MSFNKKDIRKWSILGSRGTLGVTLLDLARRNDRILVLTGDLAITSGVERFRKELPDRFYNLGVAEQNMVNVAAGLASMGNTVFATTFSNFAAMRSYEQIRLSLGYNQANVKIVGLASGLAMGMFGISHYGIEDMALMRSMPGLMVVSPADSLEVVKTVQSLSEIETPAYVRLTGGLNNPIVYKEDYDFSLGKGIVLREGEDLTIIATGSMLFESLRAADILSEKGISATVVNIHTIKPIDTILLKKIFSSTPFVVTVEEHSVIGGLGGSVAEQKSYYPNAPSQLMIGLPDRFDVVGEYSFLLRHFGLKSDQIAKKIIDALNGK
tara:strand:- start:2809 stop:3780 length:972 start_codon:yes stop_codon:yes gene_type:complete